MASVSNTTTSPVVTVTPMGPSAPSLDLSSSSAVGVATLVKRDLENFNTLGAKVWDVVPLELYGSEKENVDSFKKSALKIAAAFVTLLPVIMLGALTFVLVDSIRFGLYKAGKIDGKGFEAFGKAMSYLNKLLSPNLDFAKAVGQRLSKAHGEAINFPERNINPAGANAILRNAMKVENREILARANKMGRAELAYFKQNIVKALNDDLSQKAFSFRMGDGTAEAGSDMIDLARKGIEEVQGGEIPSIFKDFGDIVAFKDAEDFLTQVKANPSSYESAMQAFKTSKEAATREGLATKADYRSDKVIEMIKEALAIAANPSDESPESSITVDGIVEKAKELDLIPSTRAPGVKQEVSSKVASLKQAAETAAAEAAAKADAKAEEEAKAQAAIRANKYQLMRDSFTLEINLATVAVNEIIGKQAELDQLLSEIEKDLQTRGSLADGYKAVLDQAVASFKASYGDGLGPLFTALASNQEEFAELEQDLQNIIAPVRKTQKEMQDRTRFDSLRARLTKTQDELSKLKEAFDSNSKWTGMAQENWGGRRTGYLDLYHKHIAYVALRAKVDGHFSVYSPRAMAIIGKDGLVDQVNAKIAAMLGQQLQKKKKMTAEEFLAKAPITGVDGSVSAEEFLNSSPVTGSVDSADSILGDLPESDERGSLNAPAPQQKPTLWNRIFGRKTA